MADDLGRTCDKHPHRRACPDMLIDRTIAGGYGIIVHDEGASTIDIDFCPWCGSRLTKRGMRGTVLVDRE